MSWGESGWSTQSAESGWSTQGVESGWAGSGAWKASGGRDHGQHWQQPAAGWSEQQKRQEPPDGSGYRSRGSDPEGWRHGGLELRPSVEEYEMMLWYGDGMWPNKKLKL